MKRAIRFTNLPFLLATSVLISYGWIGPAHALDGANVKIMVSGDSISAGFQQASYRMPLYNSLKQNNCVVDMVGDQSVTTRLLKNSNVDPIDFPSFDPVMYPDHPAGASWSKTTGDDTDHQAFPGLRADELRAGFVGSFGTAEPVSVYAQIFAPDYILMIYGANDVNDRITFTNAGIPMTENAITNFANQTTADVTGAIDDILAAHPDPDNVKILVGNHLPRESDLITDPIDVLNEQAAGDAYREKLTAEINARTASNPNIRLVDITTGFDVETMTVDGLHPNRSGEIHIAAAFEEMIVATGGCENATVDPPAEGAIPALISPANAALSGSSTTVTWTQNNASDVERWWIRVGPNSDGSYGFNNDYYNSGTILDPSTTSVDVSGLPADGSTVYITLWYFKDGAWQLAETRTHSSLP